jgi:hypothetical protein
MRARLRISLSASALLASALLTCVLVACGFDVAGSLPSSDDADADPDAAVASGVDEAGPAVSCTTASDCPMPTNDCVVAACNGNICAATNIASGTACTTGGGRSCDGNGKCGACVVADDCARWLTACKLNTCTSSTCGAANAPARAVCTDNGGRVCDGSGTCVECVAPTDCPAQTTVCKTNACSTNTCAVAFAALGTTCSDNLGVVCDGKGDCVPMHCTDGAKDADETDIDCGGTCGATCKDTPSPQKCLVGGDCISGVCKSATLLCQPPLCTDGVRNGNETDVDCGGAGFNGHNPCPACADKKHCAKNSDCVHNACFGAGPGTCVSCSDGAKDGNETDTDCGGASCDAQLKTCATGQACVAPSDCKSGYCPANTCQLRPDGNACTTSSQCLHGACLNVTGGGKICCSSGCSDQGAASCGTNGQCKPGGAACADYPSGTTCPGATCSGSTLTTKACNGTGACQAGTTATCPGHLDCNGGGTACSRACGSNDSSGDANCAGGYWCDGVSGGACQAPKPKGGSCDRGTQCQSSCNTNSNKCM